MTDEQKPHKFYKIIDYNNDKTIIENDEDAFKDIPDVIKNINFEVDLFRLMVDYKETITESNGKLKSDEDVEKHIKISRAKYFIGMLIPALIKFFSLTLNELDDILSLLNTDIVCKLYDKFNIILTEILPGSIYDEGNFGENCIKCMEDLRDVSKDLRDVFEDFSNRLYDTFSNEFSDNWYESFFTELSSFKLQKDNNGKKIEDHIFKLCNTLYDQTKPIINVFINIMIIRKLFIYAEAYKLCDDCFKLYFNALVLLSNSSVLNNSDKNQHIFKDYLRKKLSQVIEYHIVQFKPTIGDDEIKNSINNFETENGISENAKEIFKRLVDSNIDQIKEYITKNTDEKLNKMITDIDIETCFKSLCKSKSCDVFNFAYLISLNINLNELLSYIDDVTFHFINYKEKFELDKFITKYNTLLNLHCDLNLPCYGYNITNNFSMAGNCSFINGFSLILGTYNIYKQDNDKNKILEHLFDGLRIEEQYKSRIKEAIDTGNFLFVLAILYICYKIEGGSNIMLGSFFKNMDSMTNDNQPYMSGTQLEIPKKLMVNDEITTDFINDTKLSFNDTKLSFNDMMKDQYKFEKIKELQLEKIKTLCDKMKAENKTLILLSLHYSDVDYTVYKDRYRNVSYPDANHATYAILVRIGEQFYYILISNACKLFKLVSLVDPLKNETYDIFRNAYEETPYDLSKEITEKASGGRNNNVIKVLLYIVSALIIITIIVIIVYYCCNNRQKIEFFKRKNK